MFALFHIKMAEIVVNGWNLIICLKLKCFIHRELTKLCSCMHQLPPTIHVLPFSTINWVPYWTKKEKYARMYFFMHFGFNPTKSYDSTLIDPFQKIIYKPNDFFRNQFFYNIFSFFAPCFLCTIPLSQSLTQTNGMLL